MFTVLSYSRTFAIGNYLSSQELVRVAPFSRQQNPTNSFTEGLDPTTNPTLASALRNAKSLDVPKDNINSALAKAAGPQVAEDAKVAYTYEAMGPGNFPMVM